MGGFALFLTRGLPRSCQERVTIDVTQEDSSPVPGSCRARWLPPAHRSLGYPVSSAACTVAYYPPPLTACGTGVLSRNYDFTTGTFRGQKPPLGQLAATARPYVLELHPDSGYATLALVSYNLLGSVLDGINSEGLAVALLADDEITSFGLAQPVTNGVVRSCSSSRPTAKLVTSSKIPESDRSPRTSCATCIPWSRSSRWKSNQRVPSGAFRPFAAPLRRAQPNPLVHPLPTRATQAVG